MCSLWLFSSLYCSSTGGQNLLYSVHPYIRGWDRTSSTARAKNFSMGIRFDLFFLGAIWLVSCGLFVIGNFKIVFQVNLLWCNACLAGVKIEIQSILIESQLWKDLLDLSWATKIYAYAQWTQITTTNIINLAISYCKIGWWICIFHGC